MPAVRSEFLPGRRPRRARHSEADFGPKNLLFGPPSRSLFRLS